MKSNLSPRTPLMRLPSRPSRGCWFAPNITWSTRGSPFPAETGKWLLEGTVCFRQLPRVVLSIFISRARTLCANSYCVIGKCWCLWGSEFYRFSRENIAEASGEMVLRSLQVAAIMDWAVGNEVISRSGRILIIRISISPSDVRMLSWRLDNEGLLKWYKVCFTLGIGGKGTERWR